MTPESDRTEGNIAEGPADRLGNDLRSINSQIAQLLKRRERYQLYFKEEDELKQLHIQKNNRMIQALQLRHSDANKIGIVVAGRPEDPLHPFSRNRIVITFGSPNGSERNFRTGGNLQVLRRDYRDDILQLIGTPNGFLKESNKVYLERTIYEINEVGWTIKQINKDSYPDLGLKEELQKLKVELAERVLRFRKDDPLGKELIKVSCLQDSRHHDQISKIIEVRFVGPPDTSALSFHLIPHSLPLKNRVEQLIEAGGGYDSESRRRLRRRK